MIHLRSHMSMWVSPGSQSSYSLVGSAHYTLPARLALPNDWTCMPFPGPAAAHLAWAWEVTPAWYPPSSPELEMAKARNQLDAVLQCLLEKSHMDRLGSDPGQGHGKLGALVGGTLWLWVGPQRLT